MKLEVRIIGQSVHQIGYRVFLLNAAIELGCRRFSAQNLIEDGSQLLVTRLEGDEMQTDKFKEFVQTQRPAGAEVTEISFYDYQGHVMSVEDHMHISMVEQLNKGIPALLRIDDKQGKMLEKQDGMLDKQDQMLEKQDKMLDKQDQMLAKLDEVREDVVGEIRASKEAIVSELKETRDSHAADIKDLRVDLRSYLDDKLGKIENDIVLIKAKVGLP
ncbi:MAG: acylphosphatase [Methanotrichaceae archaeon]|nr:acylphosphatase [Methanotrichaceae archaeon]